MDSLTHIAIGVCIGEAFFEKGFGKKAMLWGALAQSIPDVDFIAAMWLTPSEALLAHRGFTHSILFGILSVLVFCLLAQKIHKPNNISFRKWLAFFFTAVFVHLFIDAFNNYGIGWFEPFSLKRISFNTIYVADPFFSFMLWIAAIRLSYLNRYSIKRRFWWKAGMLVPFVYLLLAIVFKLRTDRIIESDLQRKAISYSRYFSTPAPLQVFLWYIVVERKDGFLVAYRSIFDSGSELSFVFYPKFSQLIEPIHDHEALQRLIRFSQGYYTLEHKQHGIQFNDLRFGQVAGWSNQSAEFVFHSLLKHTEEDRLIIQRGRISMFNADDLRALFQRVYGD